MKKNKFNFKKFGLVLCALFVALFAFMPFANFNNICSVSADAIDVGDVSVPEYTFYGSTIWVPFTVFDTSKNPSYHADGSFLTNFGNFMFTIKKDTNNSIYFNVSGSSVIDDTLTKYTGSATLTLTNNEHAFYLLMNEDTSLGYSNTFYIYFYLSSNDITKFVPNIYKLREWYDWNSTSFVGGNHIRYYDTNDNYLDISITCYFKPVGVYAGSSDTPFGMTDRTYYFNNDLTDNQMYNQGYQDGLSANQDNVYNQGYNSGLTEGYNNGYNKGVNDSNQYSFYNLFGAVLDAPVKVFTGLFNFNLLGVNLLGLITGLITLAFVILIVKLCIGGK